MARHRGTPAHASEQSPMTSIPYRVWDAGCEIDEQAHRQMRNACSLPIAAAAAMMPDAHVGYGLPIGGVLATRGCVIPYAALFRMGRASRASAATHSR